MEVRSICSFRLLVVMCWGEPWNGLPRASTLDADANLRFVIGAGLAQDDHGIQCLGIQPCHQITLLGTVFLPKLANLDLLGAHKGLALTVECDAKCVNYPQGSGTHSVRQVLISSSFAVRPSSELKTASLA